MTTLEEKKAFLKLPIEERRAIMAEQADELKSHYDEIMEEEQGIEYGQRCTVCNTLDRFNYFVPDEQWAIIVPEEYRNGHVCLNCLDDLADEKDMFWEALSIYFAGKRGNVCVTDEKMAFMDSVDNLKTALHYLILR